MWRLWLDDLDRSVFGVCVDFGFEHHVVFEYRVNGGCLDLLQGEVLVLFPRYYHHENLSPVFSDEFRGM